MAHPYPLSRGDPRPWRYGLLYKLYYMRLEAAIMGSVFISDTSACDAYSAAIQYTST